MTVSVCIATYNGQRYIKEQLDSILNQSMQVDEICIVDDFSTDNTVNIIEEYNSSRIKIFRNKENLGYVKSFERSVELSSCDIIFLCDQDDIWCRNKVEKMLFHFECNPEVNVICHNATVVDSENKPLDEISIHISPGLYGRCSLLRDLIKPRFFGCVCSFRSSLKSTFLPFNRHVYTHDHWLVINGFLSGGCLVVPDKLMNYRRHSQALTKHSSDPFLIQIENRLKYIFMAVMYYARKYKRVTNG